MYTLIIFTMTFISVFSTVLGGQTDDLTNDARRPRAVRRHGQPGDRRAVGARPGVTHVTPFVRAFPEWLADFRATPLRFPISGFDESLLAAGVPVLADASRA